MNLKCAYISPPIIMRTINTYSIICTIGVFVNSIKFNYVLAIRITI